jgi:hypothetical protein
MMRKLGLWGKQLAQLFKADEEALRQIQVAAGKAVIDLLQQRFHVSLRNGGNPIDNAAHTRTITRIELPQQNPRWVGPKNSLGTLQGKGQCGSVFHAVSFSVDPKGECCLWRPR